MSITFVTGGLGDGKSLYCITKIRDYLAAGKRVATNYNLNLEHLCSGDNRRTRAIRVPDAPGINDLRAIGYGSELPGDKNNGLLVLDELGTWFNARDFGSKERLKVLKYIIHLRKKRWDVVFIVQDFSMVDKQLRGSMTTYLVSCRSSHKAFFVFRLLPKFHIAVVRNKEKIKVRTDYYTASDLWKVYDTEQLFNVEEDAAEALWTDPELAKREKEYADRNGLYSYLPPGYTGGKPAPLPSPAGSTRSKPFRWMAAAGVALPILAWWMQSAPADALDQVEAHPLQADIAQQLEQDLETASPRDSARLVPFAELYGQLRIASYARFGDGYVYRFKDAAGQIVTQQQLEHAGIAVRNRGRDNALLVSQQREWTEVH